MAKENQHVEPTKDNKWGVKGEGNQRLTKKTDTQQQAIGAAREIAKKKGSEVVIHRKDGTIRDKDSYGNDPRSPQDKKH